MAASMASQDIFKIRNAVDQLGWKQTEPSALLNDSKGAKALADNPIMKGLAKHILRRELYVREQTQAGALGMYHVQTELNVSDMLTKPTSFSSSAGSSWFTFEMDIDAESSDEIDRHRSGRA